MNPKNMEKMKLLGKGNTAEVFDCGNGTVCKLFFEGYPNMYAALEFQNAEELYRNNLSVPKPFQMVTLENRRGIIYEKIAGKVLSDKMAAKEINLENGLKMLVNLQLDTMAHHSEKVLSYKEFLIAMLKGKNAEEQTVVSRITALPDDDCLLHGDLHPENIMVTPNGRLVIIDFMNVCRGPALYDIARTYFLIRQSYGGWAERYLQEINVLEKDIREYLNLIAFCRQYEG